MSSSSSAMARGLALLNRIASSSILENSPALRKGFERGLFHATRTGFRVAGAASRIFKPAKADSASRPTVAGADLFDLSPTDEQAMMQESLRAFAAEKLRPAAGSANEACAAPEELIQEALALGLPHMTVPEALGGYGGERSALTNVLVSEALAHGDMGLALATLAPVGVSQALALWGSAAQQATYLPAFVGEQVPAAALALQEPRVLFNPFVLEAKATPSGDGYVLNGRKSMVPRAAQAELFLVAANLPEKGPALFIVESSSAGISIEAEPSMGVRAAGLGQLVLQNVRVPQSALLGEDAAPTVLAEQYRQCVHLSRLAWCALAVGTSQAVLDYVIPYVNDREAFGEPISHRQGVAFMVSNIAIELEGMRLLLLRAASRADQGLSFAREAALARRFTADRAMQIGSDGVQLLGGHGFVKEHPAERWLRDLRAAGVMEGGLLV